MAGVIRARYVVLAALSQCLRLKVALSFKANVPMALFFQSRPERGSVTG